MDTVGATTCAFVFLLMTFCVTSYNFAPEFAQVLRDPANETRSYFGFTVALRRSSRDGEPQIIVGAPRAKPWSLEDTIRRPGRVYICSLNEASCEPLYTSRTGFEYNTGGVNYSDGNMGYSIDVEMTKNFIVACSPTWKVEKKCFSSFNIPSRPNGICYIVPAEKNSVVDVTRVHPLTNCDSQVIEDYYFAYGEFGVSMQIVQNSSEIIVGAPGVLQWKGAVLRYKLKSKKIDCTCSSILNIKENSYLGYSVSYGKFTSKDDMSYVTSAPRGAENRGKVFVFNFEGNWNVLKQREGTQFGEYFGASLGVGDFNKDGLDDLLVGAPQHSIKENFGDEGCVYILISTETGWKELGKQGVITGSQRASAKFGSAISVVGDINMDGFLDVAIGAPFENGKGAIYIYHGNRFGLSNTYSQRITPSESSNLRGFGYSISRGLDIDGNQINDIAIGSYISGHVILLKTYRIVTIIAKLIPENKEIPFTSQSFGRLLCLSSLETYSDLNLELEVRIKVDQHYKRALFNGTKLSHMLVFNETLNNTKSVCRNVSVEIKNQTAFSHPIEFLMEYRIISPIPLSQNGSSFVEENRKSSFCERCVLRNPLKPSNFKWAVPYVPDSIPADLNVEASINVTSPYTVGSTSSIEFRVQLTNTNERAMEPMILVNIPLKVLKIPPSCRKVQDIAMEYGDTSELICDAPSPFPKGKEYFFNFTLSTSAMPFDIDELTLYVKTYSRSLEKNKLDNTASVKLQLRRIFQLDIHGRSEEYAIIHHENEIYNEGQEGIGQKVYKHNYKVINYGPSPATDLKLYFEIPHKVLVMGVPMEVLSVVEYAAYLEEQPLLCTSNANFSIVDYSENFAHEETLLPANRTFILSCVSPDVQCMKFQCSIGNFDANSYGMHVSFILRIVSKKIGLMMGLKDIILIKTFGHIISPHVHAEVHSVVWTTLQDNTIDFSILAMSIGFGCLILFVCLLLLIKLGFFRRRDAMERYYRKKTALALQSNNVPPSRFYSQRGSIMVF